MTHVCPALLERKQMPIKPLEENPNCKLTRASFRLAGDALNPMAVTDRLRISPTLSHAKGDSFSTRTRTGTRRTGVWSLSSRDQVTSTSLEKHLTFLLDKIGPLREEVRGLCEEQKLQADFYCLWLLATLSGGPEFSPEVLNRISQFGAYLSIEFGPGPRTSEQTSGALQFHTDDEG